MTRPLLVLLMLSTAGCAVGPDYKAPEIRLASTFAESSAGPIGEVASRRWWTRYSDPVLNDLVARGLGQNLDLAASNERIAAANAALRQTGLSAAVDGSATFSSDRSGSDLQPITTQSGTTLNAQFVIDLFGGVRRARQAALANLGAAQADVGVTRLAYLSSILGAYIDARYYQNALELTRKTIASRQRTLEITQNQRASGAATELDEVQVQALLDSARADLPGLEANFLANVYAMATLLAEPAQPLVARMQRGAPQPYPRDTGGIGIPADLVRNRPDVRQAERQFAQAVAQVGVATAQLYPSVTLSGSVSEGGSNGWSFGPSIAQAILNQPQLRAAREEAASEARQSEIAWRQSVLDAVEDVQSANSTFRRDGRRVALLNRSVNSYQRALDLSQQNFEAGALSLLDLLDTDRSLASARLSLASALRDQAVDWATLQIALGAGAYPAL
ncbi:efflux transporter outer membrane subunit [Falsirhodobacter sp. 20TX0035]|uniref:efflux transporter outer membrane subunit n=1 Tax=Falsirhodobacter sp. 20TX0035 TaxID=3022019 RepID=UPI002331232A|nr:efflux transporter outer membrane subunit [Falsirhodobacter sp. 20TX0035]MDB6453607.1 efflux transporter outer membrane subunit [Falsirhodobacter sp. 20TX0035]